MKTKILPLIIALLPITSLAQANTTTNIAELFPFAAQSHDEKGELEMSSSTVIKGSNNHQLDFRKKENDKDDIKGKCDDERCTLTDELGDSYSLSWNKNWKWEEKWKPQHADFPKFKNINFGGRSIECDYNNNQNATFTDSSYQNIEVKNSCTIAALQTVTIKEKIEVSGNGTLYLAPGDYWVKEVDLQGSGKIKPTKSGAINLYVKKKVDLGSQPLGTAESPVNIYHYDDDDFELKAKLTGSLSTHGKLKMSGSSKLDYLRESKSVELEGSAELTLLPNTYWFEEFDVSGAAKIIQPQPGDVNLEVKENVSIKISQLGGRDRPVNINEYNESVDLGGSLTWYGNLNTHDELDLHGGSKLYGAVRAKSLDLQGAAELHLAAGEYWYKDIELQGGSKIELVGDRLTHLHILEELKLKGGSHINSEGKPLLFFVYGDDDDDKDDGKVALQGSSSIHGHLYVQGEVELQGGEGTVIYGAVNVVDLDMKGSTRIIYRELEGVAPNFSHYQLTYNRSSDGSNSGNAVVKACADESCTAYIGDIDTLIIKDTYTATSVLDYPKFSKTSSAQSLTVETCVQLEIAQATPVPATIPALQCVVDGEFVTNCKICTDAQPKSNYGYVFGELELSVAAMSNNEVFEIVDYQGTAGLTDALGNELKESTKNIDLPLTVTHSQVADISLVLQSQDGRQYPITLGFVPKALAWETDLDVESCGTTAEGFIYSSDYENCKVLSKAGDTVALILQAYGENPQGELQKIADYDANLGEILNISELNESHLAYQDQTETLQSLTFNGQGGNGHRIDYAVKKVGLINASITESCAPFAVVDGSCVIKTAGQTMVLGRTVPGSLQVTGIAGSIADGVVYRAKPVEFTLLPQFEVVACAANSNPCKELPSYTGEFAKGLALEDRLAFSVDSDPDNQLKIRDAIGEVTFDKTVKGAEAAGTHTIQLSDSFKLEFKKQTPKNAETILQQLKLGITINSDAVQASLPLAGAGSAKLDEHAELRFGFLTLDDLELPTNTDGKIPAHLNYYEANLKTIKQDNQTDIAVVTTPSSFILKSESESESESESDLGLEFEDRSIILEANKVPWRGTIEMEVPIWLKSYDKKNSSLINPFATLYITDNPRKRGNDQIFNRREVIR